MKFSITIPAYKAQFLRECIVSILSQTFVDFELIIVDDNSPQNLDEIVFQLQRKKHISTKKISFEGYQFSCPNNVEAYLAEQYGDWKKLPEPNSIHTHNVIVKFL